MSAFVYQAVDPRGRKARGVIEAASAAAARKTLRGQRLLPVSVEPTRARATGQGRAGSARIGVRGLTLITRQLATLVGSGVRIEDALKTVADQSGSNRQTSLLLNLRASVLDGRSFGGALDDYPAVFGDFYRASVRAGESSGQLGQVLEHLARHVETSARNRQKLQLALLYPALLALVSFGVIVALLTYVVPDIVRVFSARGADLPGLTRGLIAVSERLGRYGPIVAVSGLAAGLGLTALLRNPDRRRIWHRMLAETPGLRGMVRRINAAQFASTLATLVVSRVPLADALAAAADTVPNLHLRAKVAGVAVRVREGASLAAAMTEAGVFPPLLIAMVASGEASGTLGDGLTRAAEDQGRDIAALVAAIVALVEPGVLLVMGGIVMLLVLSILMPIMGLTGLVGG